jgi:hypothetical protein
MTSGQEKPACTSSQTVESGSFETAKTFRIKQLNNSAKHSEREKINPAGKNHHNDQPLSDLSFARESRAPRWQRGHY